MLEDVKTASSSLKVHLENRVRGLEAAVAAKSPQEEIDKKRMGEVWLYTCLLRQAQLTLYLKAITLWRSEAQAIRTKADQLRKEQDSLAREQKEIDRLKARMAKMETSGSNSVLQQDLEKYKVRFVRGVADRSNSNPPSLRSSARFARTIYEVPLSRSACIVSPSFNVT